jgi:hypothetical protein
MQLSKAVIQQCVEEFQKNNNLVGLYIPEIIIGNSFWTHVRSFERSFYNTTVIDAVRFIPKKILEETGMFDEQLYAAEDWDLNKRIKQKGNLDIITAPLYHDETYFSLETYLQKKRYYTPNLDLYIKKWGKDDPDIQKQFGLYYRYIGVFVEKNKWQQLFTHPLLTIGMYFLKFLIGCVYILNKKR